MSEHMGEHEKFVQEAKLLLIHDSPGTDLYHNSPEFKAWVDITSEYLWAVRSLQASLAVLTQDAREEAIKRAAHSTPGPWPWQP